MLIILTLGRPQLSRHFVNRITRLLGTSSYSFYLLHAPILLVVVPALYSLTNSVMVSVAGGFAVSLAAALGVYQWIERPCQESGRRLATRLASHMNRH